MTTTTTTTPILKTHPHSRRFLPIALAFAAGAALGVAGTALISRDRAVTRTPGAESAAAAAARTVAEHDSITAIEHRDRVALAGDVAARTVAEHGSITAIEHRDQLALAGDVAARTVAEHGSITAIEHRDQLALAGDVAAQIANRQHEQFRQNLITVHDGRYRFDTSAD
jgi:hypothetical protein